MNPREILPSWLRKEIPPAKLDEEMLAELRKELGPKFALPEATKDYIEQQSRIILSQREAGDKIYWFKMPINEQRPLTNREGYALVRQGRIIAAITTWIM